MPQGPIWMHAAIVIHMPWGADSSRAKARGQQAERSGQPDLVQQFAAFGGLHFDDLCMPPVVAPLDLHK